MTQFRAVVLTTSFLLALCEGAAQAQPNAKPMLTLQMPALPDPVRVTLAPATTALLVLDYVEPICSEQPKCKGQMLPAMIPCPCGGCLGQTVAYPRQVCQVGRVEADAQPVRGPARLRWVRDAAPAHSRPPR